MPNCYDFTWPWWIKGHQCPWKIMNKLQMRSFKEVFFNSLWPKNAIWQHRSVSTLAQGMVSYTSTKPLRKPLLIYHQWGPVAITLIQFHKRCLSHQWLKSPWKYAYLKFHSDFWSTKELSYHLSIHYHLGSGRHDWMIDYGTCKLHLLNQRDSYQQMWLPLTWFNFNPSMDK